MYKILYISGSIGLGHVSNDYAIAQKIRELHPDISISWIATDPADGYLKAKGEPLHEKSGEFTSYSSSAEKAAGGPQLNLIKYVLFSLIGWVRNVLVFRKIIRNERFDLIVGNETYEILIALIFRLVRFKIPFVIIFDFLGLESMTRNPFEKLINYILNWIWSRDFTIFKKENRKAIFIGEPEDIPDNIFGFLLPNRREYAKANYEFIGYIVSFDPSIIMERQGIRKKLGYEEGPLIVCSIGGTAIGRDLLLLCMDTYPLLQEKLDGPQMVIIAGPRLSTDELPKTPGIEVKGFVPNLYEYFAAGDIAIVQGGGTSTLELATLKRPFIYFPIEGHSEQKLVSERLQRYNAGIPLDLSQTTPEILADQIQLNMNKRLPYKAMRTDGAERAAGIICSFLG